MHDNPIYFHEIFYFSAILNFSLAGVNIYFASIFRLTLIQVSKIIKGYGSNNMVLFHITVQITYLKFYKLLSRSAELTTSYPNRFLYI